MKRFATLLMIPLICISVISCKGKKGKGPSESIEDIPEQKPITVSGMMQDSVMFPSLDAIPVRAVIYSIDSTSPVIVLCHQARMNNYEYAEIAPKLNKMGFNCMAVDLRSGGAMDNHQNVTYEYAVSKNLPVEFLNAEPDMIAAVNYASTRWHQPVILWGSSFSAGLALKTTAKNENVRAAVAFSPFEYEGLNLKSSIKELNKPTFITSTEKEAGAIEKLIADVTPGIITQYFPDTKGTHGSKALWSSDPSNEYYWTAITEWLNTQK
ncbi:MAG: alpha/beta hydrolase [Chitinophagales bacterium]